MQQTKQILKNIWDFLKSFHFINLALPKWHDFVSWWTSAKTCTHWLRGFGKLPIRFELVRSKQRGKGVERNGLAHFSWAHTQYTMLRYFSLYYWWHFPAAGCSAETAIATLKDVSSTALISSGTNKISFSCSVFSCYAGNNHIYPHWLRSHTHTASQGLSALPASNFTIAGSYLGKKWIYTGKIVWIYFLLR